MVGSIAVYFLPSMIGRKKANRGAIFALSLFLGWTLVGWVVAWALTVEEPRRTVVEVYNQPVRNVSCQRCGGALNPGAQFCPGCGVPISATL
jgi:hypothetical protein